MKALAILNGSKLIGGVKHFCKRMQEELALLGVDLEVKSNNQILSLIDTNGSVISNIKNEYDFVLYLDKDLYASLELERLGFRLFNSAEAIRLCDDKMLTYIALSDQGIKMPKTVFAPLNYSGSYSPEFLVNLKNNLILPVIVKENHGSQGTKVGIIKTDEELADYEKNHFEIPHLYQEFISSSKGIDVRMIVIGGHVVASMLRMNFDGDFRSNIAGGGIGKEFIPNHSFIVIA